MTVKSYDQKCYDLAALFLGDEPHLHTTDRCDELAKQIQETIEQYIYWENENYEPPQHGDAWTGGFAENH